MATKDTKKIEREYTIPLRNHSRRTAIYKRTPKAVKTVKEFLAKHMKVENRDLSKVKLDSLLNEALWYRGIRKPIHKIKVKAIKEDGVVTAHALSLPTNLEYKKKRLEKIQKQKQEAKLAQEKAKKALKEKEKESEKKTSETKEKPKEESKKTSEEKPKEEKAKKEAPKKSEKKTSEAKEK